MGYDNDDGEGDTGTETAIATASSHALNEHRIKSLEARKDRN